MLALLLGLSAGRAQAQTVGTENLGANQVTLKLTSATTGTGAFTMLPGSGATCGTAAQIVAGQNSSSTAVPHGSLALVSGTAGNYTVRNLLGGTTYTVCFTPDGTTTPVNNNITTSAATVYTSPVWSDVGSAGFSTGQAFNTTMAFSPDGTPYLVYVDGGNSDKATVMRYNGTAWELVGSAGFSEGAAQYTSLAFSPDGTPYVGY